jgi:hypothetical protein
MRLKVVFPLLVLEKLGKTGRYLLWELQFIGAIVSACKQPNCIVGERQNIERPIVGEQRQ